jgi:hypothetical protein
MFLQAACQIFIDRLARLGSWISHSIDSDIHSDFMHLTHYTVLLSVILAAFRHLDSIMSYDHSKLCCLRIICKILMFIFKNDCFRFLSYPRTAYLCKHSV